MTSDTYMCFSSKLGFDCGLLIQVADKVLMERDGNGAPWDARVNAARMLTELLMFFLSRRDMYSSSNCHIKCANRVVDVTDRLDDLLRTRVAPLLRRMMLSDSDPMPLYAQKILATLLSR
jgi:hypothetical protein